MTLSRQLISLIFVTFVLIFSGTFWISVENTRSYLMLQLATQTQSAADALGLSLVPYMQNKDIAAMDTMVNAMFDSGYYKSLKLSNMSGETLIERENTSQQEAVPQWFIEQLSLLTPTADSIITTGWTQAGRLQLSAHPGFAYQKLWQTSVDMLQWSLLAFILSLLAVLLILRAILRPLDAVEQQALAISQREFPVLEDIPRTRELKRVVLAMNKMSAKVEGFISKLTQRAELLRQEAHYDALTGLVNRRAFLAQLNNIIKDHEKGGSGALAVVRMSGFADYNQQHGHQAGDDLLVEVGKALNEISDQYPASTTARISGTDFAIILPLADADIADEFGLLFSAKLDALADRLKLDAIAQIGIACFDHDKQIGHVLADADTGLSLAEQAGVNTYALQNKSSEVGGNQQWQALIEDAIQDGRIRLQSQPVLGTGREGMYSEVLIRMKGDDGKYISPGAFTSMAERLGLNGELDRHVIERVVQLLKVDSAMPLAVNIAASSMRDEVLLRWLDKYFAEHGDVACKMYFEVTEHALLQDDEAANDFITLVHKHGGKVVMEHFGTRLSSFQSLRQLKLDYIKIDGSYTRHIAEHSDNQFFLQTVTDIAHGLDIQVIAEHVESEADFNGLQGIGINAMQGYYLGEPQPLD
ncbi:MAG: EAL domain-containing protein [Mariprofundus sp.]|nr:EAL domain-containing protein [Mariprofundus sp.]